MKPVTKVLVERLRRGLLSRNRNFQLFRRPEARGALRIHHFLRSLERDLLPDGETPAPGEGSITVEDDQAREGVRLRIELPHLRTTRTAFLSHAEYGILLAHPELRGLPPLGYVMAARAGRAEPLAKFVRLGKGSYHGAFIVRATSPFKDLASLRGRRIAYTDPRSSAGYLFPRAHLARSGFDPDTFFS